MISKIDINKWQFIALMVLVTAAIPIVITAFELITTDKESVIFLEHYHPVLGMIVIAYYVLLLVLGVAWLVKQVVSFIKVKNETAKNELQHLQSQINPHFFFNVLNNLYGLVDKDAKKAQQLILKLSDMMRYSIYDGQKKVVAIAEETDYLKNFIDLHQMRYHKNIDIKFETNIENEQLQVMPLMFIILLENAFKHGVEHLRSNAYVHLELSSTKDTVYFAVENNFDPEEVSEQKGVGLTNLKRRLDLVYPKKHTLTAVQTDDVYKAQLTLNQL
ncbi:MAG: two-component system sensor histidine kinase AlgZ [Saprospiraceae bacterium]|jgi:two-component system sensor histidine kinase AlgZ